MVWTDVLQLVKTVAAAVIAWLLAVEVFSLPQSFLAPWAALLTVHATVYRTLTRGIQQAAAAVVGVLLAFAVTPILGVSWASLALVLLAALAVGAIGPMREESTTAAATALVVLLTGLSDDGSMLLARLADTIIGIAVGLAVNLAVWPPLRDRGVHARIDDLDDRLGALLADMASGLQSNAAPEPDRWVEHTRELDHGIDDAWADVRRARESGRLNLRGNAAQRHPGHTGPRRRAGGPRAGGRRHAQHGANDRTCRRRRRLGATIPRRLGRHPRPHRGRGARCEHRRRAPHL